MIDAVSDWFKKQEPKNELRRENIKKIREVDNMNNKKKILTVAVDAGKGYTKYAYKKMGVGKDKEGNEIEKEVWITDIEISTVVKGEADFGNTTYIKNKGEEDYTAFNFNVNTKAVETAGVTKNNAEHKALMQRALYKISKKENITDFNVIMCTSLDQFRNSDNVNDMQKEMDVKEFSIKDDIEETVITIHNMIIQPETLGATRFAKTKVAVNSIVLVDIGTLNVGIVPINKGKFEKKEIIAPREGYNYMVDMFKEFTDTKGFDYKKTVLEIYIDDKQGLGHKLDEVFKDFFINEYAELLKKRINQTGFSEFSKLVFMGGTSVKCANLIEEAFKDSYEGVEVIKDIYATVKGAYIKGSKELEKINNN